MARFTQEQLYAPCPCGSGNKLKFCCVNAVKVAHPDDSVCDRCGDALEYGNFDVARTIIEPLFARGTTSIRAYNARAVIAFHDGDDERGLDLAREVWTSLAPGHAYAGALLAHGLAATGEVAEANEVADDLVHVPILDPTHTHQMVTALGALGRDEDVVSVAARGPLPHTGVVDMVSAVSLVNLGRLDEARPALRRAITSAPHSPWLREILREVERGRIPSTPFGRIATLPIDAWLPGGNTRERVMEMAHHPERTSAITKRYPILIELYKQMVTMPAGTASRDVGLAQLGRAGARAELLAFVEGSFGDDDDRFRAARALVENGLVEQGHPFRMRIRGKLDEVRVSGGPIGATQEQADVFGIPARLQREYERAIELSRAGKHAQAEKAMDALLVKAPNHPVMRFNALASRMSQNKGTDAEGIERVRAIVDDFPDYLFARAALATLLVRDKRVDDADAVLNEQHIGRAIQPEWAALALFARARIELARGNIEGATVAVESAEQMGFDVEERAPELAILRDMGRMVGTWRARREAKEEKCRRRHVAADASFEEWFDGCTVDELRRIARVVGVRGAHRRAGLLDGLEGALSDRSIVESLQRALSADARRGWDALLAAGGRIDHDEFIKNHDKATAELRCAGLVVIAAVDGAPSVAIPAVVRRSLGIGENRPDKDEGTWSVGIVQMPQIRIAGTQQTPIIAIVTGGDGRVLAQAVGDLDARRELIATAFTKACGGGRPARITAADDDIVRSLVRAGADADTIVVGESADLDQVSSLLRYAVAGSQSYLETGASAAAVRGLFDAAAELYISAPWGAVPDDGCLFRIFLSGGDEVVACVIGQLGEEHGYLLFDSVAACVRWRECLQSTAAGAEVTWAPTVVALNFEVKDELAPPLHDEIRRNGWRIAGPAAFPLVMRTGSGLSPEPPMAEDFVKLEIAARAIGSVLRDKEATWPPGEVRDIDIVASNGSQRVRVEFALVD